MIKLINSKIKYFIITVFVLSSVFLPLPGDYTYAEESINFVDIEAENIEGKIIKITWQTNINTQGRVIFGEEEDDLRYYVIDTKAPTRFHEVKIGNLEPETDYYYQVIAYNDFEQVKSFVKEFETEFKDETAPRITDIKIPYRSGTAAVITWETDEEATSRVEYSEDDSYKKKAGSSKKVTEHQVVLKKLETNAEYFIRLYSEDKEKNKSNYFYKDFTTLSSDKVDKEDFSLSNLRPSGPDDIYISAQNLRVSFKTNRWAKGTISLKGKKFKTQKIDLDYGLNHTAVFSDLTPDKEYTLYISMVDIFSKKVKEDFKIKTKTITAKQELDVADTNIIYEIGEGTSVAGIEYPYYTPASALVTTKYSHRVYSIINNLRYHITSPTSFSEYGYNWGDVKKVDEKELLKYSRVKLLKTPEDPTIYFLYQFPNSRLLKINIPSPSIFLSYPDNSWGKVVKVAQNDVSAYPDVKLIKAEDNPDVYYLENGRKRYISYEVFKSKDFNDSEIAEINEIHLDSYQTGQPLE
jgi:hypothetical protein